MIRRLTRTIAQILNQTVTRGFSTLINEVYLLKKCSFRISIAAVNYIFQEKHNYLLFSHANRMKIFGITRNYEHSLLCMPLLIHLPNYISQVTYIRNQDTASSYQSILYSSLQYKSYDLKYINLTQSDKHKVEKKVKIANRLQKTTKFSFPTSWHKVTLHNVHVCQICDKERYFWYIFYIICWHIGLT